MKGFIAEHGSAMIALVFGTCLVIGLVNIINYISAML